MTKGELSRGGGKPFSAEDKAFMAEAVRLGESRRGATGENPSVGAVLVREEGGRPVIIGRGATGELGRPHAETQALAEAGAPARGATLYVSLEPCCHFGQTPPCTNALIQAGVTRAVIAVSDPDSRVSGGGIAQLRQAGLAVEVGCLAAEAAQSLAAYLCRKRFSRPFITAKLAVSADGFIGRAGEGKIAVSGAEAQRQTHRLRAAHDGVLIGIGTALADNPRLDCRLLPRPLAAASLPVRIVCDTRLRLRTDSYLAATAKTQPVWLLCGEQADKDKRAQLERAGCRVFPCALTGGRIDLAAALAVLFKNGINSVLVEGGTQIIQSFWDNALIDRLVLFQSGLIIGEKGYKKPDFGAFTGYEDVSRQRFGADIGTIWLRLWGKNGLLGARQPQDSSGGDRIE